MLNDEDVLLHKIAGGLPVISAFYAQFTRKFLAMRAESYFPEASEMLKKACDMLSERKDIGAGYHMRVLGAFDYCGVPFNGLHLTLIGPNSETVGALGFRIGIPFEITAIQGPHNSLEPMKFAVATGTTFDRVLMDRVVHCIGSSIFFPHGHALKKSHMAILDFEDSITNIKLENRLFNRYLPMSARETLNNQNFFNASRLYIKDKHFARVHRNAQAFIR